MFTQVVIRKSVDLTDAFFSVGKIATSAPMTNIIIIMATCEVICFCAGTSGRTGCNMSTNNDVNKVNRLIYQLKNLKYICFSFLLRCRSFLLLGSLSQNDVAVVIPVCRFITTHCTSFCKKNYKKTLTTYKFIL